MDSKETMDCIKELKMLLAEKENDLQQAARYGQGLLETNSYLEETLQMAYQEFEKKLEEMEQAKHSLELKLDVYRKSEERLENSLLEEKNSLKKVLDQKTEALRREYSKDTNALKLKIQALQSELDEKNLTVNQQSSKIQNLTEKLSVLEIGANDEKTNVSLSPEFTEVTSENQMLFNEVERLLEEITGLQQTIESLNLKNTSLTERCSTLENEMQQTEAENASYYNALEQCRQENRELQGEMELVRLEALDPNKRGNSLFGEVEDRRVQAEKKLISAQVKLKSMERKYKHQANYAVQLKTQIVQLLQSGGRVADKDHIQRLESQLSESQSDARNVNEKLVELEKKLSRYQNKELALVRSSAAPKDNVADLMEMMLKKKEEEVSKLKEETRKYRNDLMSETRKLNLLERDNYSVKRDRDRAHSQVAKLNLEITRLKLKCGEEVEGRKVIRFTKVEKIEDDAILTAPPSENKENTLESCENVTVKPFTSTFIDESLVSEADVTSNPSPPFQSANKMHAVTQECPEQCKQQ